ncbi:hypothetical protein PHMEG_0008310 [Phytophthora megakarya]|uniref:Uncharacterized protein n=1 Tax=Phytophthora megakarya TaxID=4795 RepID=A0A225WLH2_9STRA|nr:hypothetical protein PHMEG_0008310 [Phytophthora megakarya]
MHQFYASSCAISEDKREIKADGKEESPLDKEHGYETSTAPDDYEITGGTAPTDFGVPLETWLAILGGTMTDVTGTGHCGWLSFYAALVNAGTGQLEPTQEVAVAATTLKREDINGMLTNLADECQLMPHEVDAELHSAEIKLSHDSTREEKIWAFAEFYASLREGSMQRSVPVDC